MHYRHSNRSIISIFSILLIFIFVIGLAFTLQIKQLQLPSISLLLADLAVSFLRVLGSTLAAWLLGIAAGYPLFVSISLQQLFLPIINFIRQISPFAWLPFAIIWFGIGELSLTFIMLITLLFPAILGSFQQFSSLKKTLLEEADVLGANHWQKFWHIQLPLALPGLLNLFRILWGLGWSVIIAAEMLGVDNGMGFRMLDFRYLLKYPQMLSYFIVLGIIGITTDIVIQNLSRKIRKKQCLI
jgi:NitT/TauT family transport system permease protein